MAQELMSYLIYCRQKLEHGVEEEKALNYLRKLYKAPVTLQLLQDSGIIKIIKQLRKEDGKIGQSATILVNKWRHNFPQPQEESRTSSSIKKENNSHILKAHSSSKYKTSSDVSNNKRDHKKVKSSNSPDSSHAIKSKEPSKKYKVKVEVAINDSPGYDPTRPGIFEPEQYIPTPISIKQEPSSKLHKSYSSQDSATNNTKHSSSYKPSQSQESVKKHGLANHSSNSKHSKNKDVKEAFSKPLDKKPHSSSSKASCDKKFITVKSSYKVVKASNHNIKPKIEKKRKMPCAEEFTASQATFEDCLGFNDIFIPKKTKTTSKPKPKDYSPSPSPVDKKFSSKNSHSQPKDKLKKSPAEEKYSKSFKMISDLLNPPKPPNISLVDITSTLPEIQPNYKPLPRFDTESSFHKKKTLSNEEAIMYTSSKKDKTVVYSGRKNHYLTYVPKLMEMCLRVLSDHVDYIEYLGTMPYYLIKPVLERCTPQQLDRIENYNPDLVNETHELWERHCRKEFKMSLPEEGETWRELYLRTCDEKQKKLKALAANISASMSKSTPVRRAKLAYMNCVVKPPRDVARRQAKNGTALPVSHPVKPGPPSKASARPTAPAINAAVTAAAPPPKTSTYAAPPKKPKIAPLMAKTLKTLKNVYRR